MHEHSYGALSRRDETMQPALEQHRAPESVLGALALLKVATC